MTAARGALLATLVAALQTASAEPCAPRAHLDGDAEAVARVSAALKTLGIAVEAGQAGADARCPVVVAAVELDRGGGIAVAVRDATNRSEGRVVSDAALAAAWIDSWIHDDFAPELPAAPPSNAPGMMAAAPPHDSPQDAAPVAAPSLLDRLAVDAGYVRTFSFDGSGGTGFAGGACVRAGDVCVGARVSYSQLDVQGAMRDDLMATATASWSRSVGSMRFSPELGAGVGRMTTDACPAPPPCDPTTGMMCPTPPPCDQVGLHQTSYTPRLTGALRIAVPLFPHVWLDGTASVVLAPFGHTDPFPGMMPDPSGGTNPGTIAGEPDAAAQLSVGVRVGLP